MLLPALVWALLCRPGAAAPIESGWQDQLSPHFQVFHQDAFMPGGFSMALERMHTRLKFDLGLFSPWMSQERLKLYLYHDQDSYVQGQFRPPRWSNGVSLYEKRVVAVYDQPERAKLLSVISHETTHLLFESYFGEAGRQPPTWLNEGLAMVEETDPAHPEQADWFRAMVRLPERGYMPLRQLFAITPTKDLKDNKRRVENWYVESYSVVYFLLRGHSRLQFKSFCAKVRDGEDVEKALWSSYRYQSLANLERAWLRWLSNPALERQVKSAERAGAR